MRTLAALILSLSFVSVVCAENVGEKHIIFRSKSGGSASADIIIQEKQAKSSSDEMKARPSMQFVEKSTEKKTKKIYLARSGGSAGTQTIEVPAQK